MSNDNTQNIRMTLGPDLSNYLRQMPDSSAKALDVEFLSLVQSRDRLSHLEAQAVTNAATVSRLVEINSELSAALGSTSTSVTHLTDMIDHRTREFEKLLIHISTMVGSHLSDGDERDRLHARLQDIEKDLGTQLSALSSIVKDQNKSRSVQVQNAIGRAEEERLTIAEQESVLMKPQPERAGVER